MPRLLDLFCGAGGCSMGYHRAGFEVVGVDIEPQPEYPFEFVQADALTVELGGFDAIHASPPCQGYSRMRHLPWLAGNEYPLLIEPIRARLRAAGVPWIIENVEDAPLQRRSDLFGNHGVLLCGTMFGLKVYRHRPFETSFPVAQPPHGKHQEVIVSGRMFGSRGRAAVDREMGIDWMSAKPRSQAIPPAYTEFIGRQLLAELEVPQYAAQASDPDGKGIDR